MNKIKSIYEKIEYYLEENEDLVKRVISEYSSKYGIEEAFMNNGYGKNHMLLSKHYQYITSFALAFAPIRVLEIGTQTGASALCFSVSAKEVLTVDVNPHHVSKKLKENIRFQKIGHTGECLELPFEKFDVIFVDIDHSGYYELKLHELFKSKFNGLVMWDDVVIDERMQKFWEVVKNEVPSINTNWHPDVDTGIQCGFGLTYYD